MDSIRTESLYRVDQLALPNKQTKNAIHSSPNQANYLSHNVNELYPGAELKVDLR